MLSFGGASNLGSILICCPAQGSHMIGYPAMQEGSVDARVAF